MIRFNRVINCGRNIISNKNYGAFVYECTFKISEKLSKNKSSQKVAGLHFFKWVIDTIGNAN